MGAIDFDATMTPQDLVAQMSLQANISYTGQNVGTIATLFFREGSTMPAITDRSFRIEAGGTFILRPTGDPIWAWTDDAAGCPLILGEAP